MSEKVDLFSKGEVSERVEKPCLFVKEDGVEFELVRPVELLEGYEEIYAITFSTSANAIWDLLKGFRKIEVIFAIGEENRLSFYESVIIEIQERSPIWSMHVVGKDVELYQLDNSHRKLYLLGKDGTIKRVILGSANLSKNAWLFKQEEDFVVIEKESLIKDYETQYYLAKEKAKPLWTKENRREAIEIAEKKLNIRIDNAVLIGNPQVVKEVATTIKEDVPVIVARNLLIENSLPNSVEVETAKKKIEEVEKLIKALREKRKEVLVAKDKDRKIKEILKEVDKEKEKGISVGAELIKDAEYGWLYNGISVSVESDLESKAKEVVSYLKEYLEISRSVSERHFTLIGEAITFAFYSVIMHDVRQKAFQEGLENEELNKFPVFALLCGVPNAGKSTTLSALSKLLGVKKIYYDDLKGKGQSKAPSIKDEMQKDNRLPLLIDEVKPRHIATNGALEETLKVANEKVENKRALILTSNLVKLPKEIQVIRRSCFLPFHKQAGEEFQKEISKVLRGFNPSLLFLFLNRLTLKVNPQDPLLSAREFLLEMGVPVPEVYQGGYRKFMQERWVSVFWTFRENFKEIEYKGRKAYKVSTEGLSLIYPLEEFELETEEAYFVIDYDKFHTFLQEMGVKKDSLLARIKKVFRL